MNQDDFRSIVYLEIKPGCEEAFSSLFAQLLQEIRKEENFIGAFVLQDEEDPLKYIVYETWGGPKENYEKVLKNRSYRRNYEAALTKILARPHGDHTHWRLLMSGSKVG